MGKSKKETPMNGDDKDTTSVNPMHKKGDEGGAAQNHVPFHTLTPFVQHHNFPFTHRCWNLGCATGTTTTIFGSRSTSIRKSEPCSILCPFQACTMHSNMTVPWRRVKVVSVYEGSVPPEVWRALFGVAAALFALVVALAYQRLRVSGIVLLAIGEIVVVLLLGLLFRETYGEFTGKYLRTPDILLARIPGKTTQEFLKQAKSLMDSVKSEAVEKPVLVDTQFKKSNKLFCIFPLGEDTIKMKGNTGELYQNRTPCGIPCLRSKNYHRFRMSDVMWTYGEKSKRNIYVLLSAFAIAIVLIALGADNGSDILIAIGTIVLLLGTIAYYLSADAAMTIGLPTDTILSFSTADSKLTEISDAFLSSQLGRHADKEPLQKEIDGYDVSEQIADLKVYPDHIRHTSTCNWKKKLYCLCCRCCCPDCTGRCMMAMCGFSQLSGKFSKRTYIGSSTAGNPMLLIAAIGWCLVGFLIAVLLTVMLDGDMLEVPWGSFLACLVIGGICFAAWWCSRKLLVSIGLKGTDLLASSFPFGVVDPTGISAAVWFRPKVGEDCHELVEELDSLADCSIRREMLTNQKTASMERVDKGVTWFERRSKDGEFYYENAKSGDTAWSVMPSQLIYSPDFDDTAAGATGTAEP